MLVIVVGGGLLWYRATLHNWPWQGDPAEFTDCGRNYMINGSSSPPSYRLYPAFSSFFLIGPEVYSAVPPAQRAKLSRSGEPCNGLVLFVEDSRHRYTAYGLSGGP